MATKLQTQLDLFLDFLPCVLRNGGIRPNDVLTELARVVAPFGADDYTRNRLKCVVQRVFDDPPSPDLPKANLAAPDPPPGRARQ
ncbi:hypothetical protein [Phaeovulum sp.]|uniref:hypothetical protein n=1 Tax=Phaeovulum sp. TaxID=2934796 RepID=UPI00272FCDAB|nr:hypothetical protein [Phaeovulum sp.]MDP1668499.1 hypothetical protein [Phaeovulum sp.]MDZ4118782.1 hypothetical protein [Phaeovulum sp.]